MTTSNITLNTKFGIGRKQIKIKIDLNPEETFRNILNKLGKTDNWISIEWEQDGQEWNMDRSTFHETGLNFWQSIETNF